MTDPLVSCQWLAANAADPEIKIVDTRWFLGQPNRGRIEYEKSHIPGALFMDLDSELAASEGPGRHPLPSQPDFVALLGNKGIANHHHVVVYDQGPGSIAARLWWMLRSLDHQKTSVLNGGFHHWRKSSHPTETETPQPTPTFYHLREGATQTIDREQLLSLLGSVQVLDARDADRYRGEGEEIDPVSGHIPTSLSVPTTDNIAKDGTFKTSQELAQHFAALGLDPDRPIVSYCGSGVTACHNILALKMAGFPEPILYPGSWSDWSTASYPAATGEHPGSPPSHS